MEAEVFSETLSNFFQTTRHYNPEDNLHHSKEHLGLYEDGNFLIMWLRGVRHSYKLICNLQAIDISTACVQSAKM
jgi:hypothetical protein